MATYSSSISRQQAAQILRRWRRHRERLRKTAVRLWFFNERVVSYTLTCAGYGARSIVIDRVSLMYYRGEPC